MECYFLSLNFCFLLCRCWFKRVVICITLSLTKGVTEMEDHPKRLFQGSTNMLSSEALQQPDLGGW